MVPRSVWRPLSLVALLGAGCTFDPSGILVGDSRPPDLVIADQHLRPERQPDQSPGAPDLPLSDAITDAPWPDPPASCTSGWFRCVGNESQRCDASDGTYHRERDCPAELGCCAAGCIGHPSGTCYRFDPSTGLAPHLLASGTGTWTVKGNVLLDTDACALATGIFPAGVSGLGSSQACTLLLQQLKIDKGGVLTVQGQRPLLVAASETIQVDGILDVSAARSQPGPGGAPGGKSAVDGQGCGGGSSGQTVPLPSNTQGGAGGSFGGSGGGGSSVTPVGDPDCGDLCPLPDQAGWLVGGSGGGGGNLYLGGAGGGGGGALQLSALGSIIITGTLLAGGGGGTGGNLGVLLTGTGGGGGSGGAILLEAPLVQLDKDSVLAANGGGGGSGSIHLDDGKDGADGGAVATAAPGGKAPGGVLGNGGDGGSGSERYRFAGTSGGDGTDSGANGGGGGGAGRICLRAKSLNIDPNAMISPEHDPIAPWATALRRWDLPLH